MRVFPRSNKLPLDVSVQCSQQANARHHVGPLNSTTQERFYRGLPFLELLLGLWKLLDIFGSFFEGDERVAAGQGNRIIEAARPSARRPS